MRTFKLWTVVLSFACLALESRAATLRGKVTDPSNSPMANVQVRIPALQKAAKTDASGVYTLENIPSGSYAIEFRPVDYPSFSKQADLSKGDAVLDAAVTSSPLSLTPITISASAQPSSTLTTPASVSVVEGRQLDRKRDQSVLYSLQDQPGFNTINESPTIAKPIIRGLSSQDIVVVEDGLRSEALQWGNEHAPEIDPMGADRIEIMRGPNSLLYGSDALGGVISISHPELPNAKLGAGAFSGRVYADANSVNTSVGHGLMLAGAAGDWGWRGNFSQRQGGNFHNPLQGEVPNTGLQEVSGDGTVGLRKDWGNLSFDFSSFNKRVELQNPGACGACGVIVSWPVNRLNDIEYQVLHHTRGNIHANLITDFARFEMITGYDQANRGEYNGPNQNIVGGQNGGNVITAPDNQPQLAWIQTNYTTDLKVHHEPIGPVHGTLGITYLRRVEQSLGPNHLTPGYNENGWGEYLLEELPWNKFNFSAGVRSDQSHYNIGGDPLVGLGFPAAAAVPPPPLPPPPTGVAKQALNYSAFSAALGAVYHITDPLAFAFNFGQGYRNPVPFELFAYGVHEGTGQFQLGNPKLKPEISYNTDASVRWASPRLKAEFGIFRNKLFNYIYGSLVNLTDPSARGQQVVQETQSNATIQGFDMAVNGAATEWLNLKAVYNLVRGYNDSRDKSLPNHWLPHVPADNARLGVEVHERALGWMQNPYFGLEGKFTWAQRRAAPVDSGVPGYGQLDLSSGFEFIAVGNRVSVDIGATNLADKGYIDYNSILKQFNIQNPGRNFFGKISVPFGS